MCSVEMTEGKAVIHGTFLGFLMGGLFSRQKLWFWFVEGKQKLEIPILAHGKRRAFSCPACRAAVILAK